MEAPLLDVVKAEPKRHEGSDSDDSEGDGQAFAFDNEGDL